MSSKFAHRGTFTPQRSFFSAHLTSADAMTSVAVESFRFLTLLTRRQHVRLAHGINMLSAHRVQLTIRMAVHVVLESWQVLKSTFVRHFPGFVCPQATNCVLYIVSSVPALACHGL